MQCMCVAYELWVVSFDLAVRLIQQLCSVSKKQYFGCAGRWWRYHWYQIRHDDLNTKRAGARYSAMFSLLMCLQSFRCLISVRWPLYNTTWKTGFTNWQGHHLSGTAHVERLYCGLYAFFLVWPQHAICDCGRIVSLNDQVDMAQSPESHCMQWTKEMKWKGGSPGKIFLYPELHAANPLFPIKMSNICFIITFYINL